MSVTFTIIDTSDTCNNADGKKRIYGTLSFTNPYSTGGETFSVATYFPNKFLGGVITSVQQSVSTDNSGIVSTGKFRGDATSTNAVIQLFDIGLSATTKAGLLVDNTVANISNITCNIELVGY